MVFTTERKQKSTGLINLPIQFFIYIFLSPIFILLPFYTHWYHGVHTVIPQKIYRAGQLSPTRFSEVLTQYHIKTVINLRGKNPTSTWFQEEKSLFEKRNILLKNLRLDSFAKPKKNKLATLLQFLDSSPEPILIHCRGGADRTGFVSALTLILQNESSWKKIKKQYSYHFWVLNPKSIGKLTLTSYHSWLKASAKQSSKQNFLSWFNQQYKG